MGKEKGFFCKKDFTTRRRGYTFFLFSYSRSFMGNLKKKRRLKIAKHKRRKRSKANRHKKRTW